MASNSLRTRSVAVPCSTFLPSKMARSWADSTEAVASLIWISFFAAVRIYDGSRPFPTNAGIAVNACNAGTTSRGHAAPDATLGGRERGSYCPLGKVCRDGNALWSVSEQLTLAVGASEETWTARIPAAPGLLDVEGC